MHANAHVHMRPRAQPVGVVLKEVYQLLLTTLETEDPTLARCGLQRLTASDGTVAWVNAYAHYWVARLLLNSP